MASSSYQTHYEILGISQQAQPKDVRDAYRKLALKCHPDKDPYNPRAVAAFQNLGIAYETLRDENRRTKYDATLSSSTRLRQPPQPACWPSQRSSGSNATTRAWHEDRGQRPWDWLRKAQERADQARRNDNEFWSGPTYAHGATDRCGWGKRWDREQRDRYDVHEHQHQHQQRQHAAPRKARKETERRESNTNTPPPPRDPFDQGRKESQTWANRCKKEQEAQETAKREKCEDDGYWKPPPPRKPDPDESTKVEDEYQERLEKEKKERSDRRKAKREQLEKRRPAELPLLLTKIINIEVEIGKTEAKVEQSKKATRDVREDDDHEQIFDLPIKQRSMERRLNECLVEYKHILRLLRTWGREQEASEAEIKLQEASKEVARDMGAGRKGSSGRGQAESTTKTEREANAEMDQRKPLANNEGSRKYQKLTTLQIPENSKSVRCDKRINAKHPCRTTLPVLDGPNSEDTTWQRQTSHEYVAYPRVSYDGSDPDRGFTEDTPNPSRAGDDDNYDDKEYNAPSCKDFHHSHMEVHREFWDIIDSSHDCDFCHNFCAVMRCPKCDVQVCAYCKDTYG